MQPCDLNLYSIGHSNHPVIRFLDLLQQHQIQCIADVRTAPYSRFNPQYNREQLAISLKEKGISYIWLGAGLGGKNSRGQKDNNYLQGIATLISTALETKTAMMCSEEDPRNCHRHRKISTTILNGGFEQLQVQPFIHHIRGNGSIEAASMIPVSFQLPLF
jgi:uncharacterized protein (DUF488 family)